MQLKLHMVTIEDLVPEGHFLRKLDAERQKQLRLVADLTANSVSASQIDSITGYLDEWESVSFDDKRKVVDILISQIDATSESVTIHWKI